MSIGRWDVQFIEDNSGRWIKHIDHLQEVGRLTEKLQGLLFAYERMTNVLLNEGIQVADPTPAEVSAFLNEVRAQALDEANLAIANTGDFANVFKVLAEMSARFRAGGGANA